MASVADIKFEIEVQLEQQLGCLPLPFPGMDSTIRFQQLITTEELSMRLSEPARR